MKRSNMVTRLFVWAVAAALLWTIFYPETTLRWLQNNLTDLLGKFVDSSKLPVVTSTIVICATVIGIAMCFGIFSSAMLAMRNRYPLQVLLFLAVPLVSQGIFQYYHPTWSNTDTLALIGLTVVPVIRLRHKLISRRILLVDSYPASARSGR